MNKIISSLSLRAAHKTIDPNGPFTPDEFVNFSKKFAELIIADCIEKIGDVVETDEYWSRVTAASAVLSIEKHFGV